MAASVSETDTVYPSPTRPAAPAPQIQSGYDAHRLEPQLQL